MSGISISVNVKDLEKIKCIELPCFVKTPDSSFEMLGGKELVLRGLTQEDIAWQFRFPGANPIRSCLTGSTNGKQGLLIKVVRNKRTKQTSKVSVLGVVHQKIVFDNPADYQFLPASTNLNDYLYRKNLNMPLETIPQSFCRTDFAKRVQYLAFLQYSKKKPFSGEKKVTKGEGEEGDNSGNSDNDMGATNEQDTTDTRSNKKRNPDSGHTVIIRMEDPVPSSHPLGASPPRWKSYQANYRGYVLINHMIRVFAQIPVLSKPQLVDILGLGTKQHLFKECLPYVAFSYHNGPYQRLWIRYGYNVTEEPTSRIYQIISCKFNIKFLNDVSEKLVNCLGKEKVQKKMVDLTTMTLKDAPIVFEHAFIDKGVNARLPVSLFGYIFKQQMNLQIWRIMDESAFEFIGKLKVLPHFSESTGWYSAGSMDVFRSYIVDFITKKCHQITTQCMDLPYEPAATITTTATTTSTTAASVATSSNNIITTSNNSNSNNNLSTPPVSVIAESELNERVSILEDYLTDPIQYYPFDHQVTVITDAFTWLKRYRQDVEIRVMKAMNRKQLRQEATERTATTIATTASNSRRGSSPIPTSSSNGIGNSNSNAILSMEMMTNQMMMMDQVEAFDVFQQDDENDQENSDSDSEDYSDDQDGY